MQIDLIEEYETIKTLNTVGYEQWSLNLLAIVSLLEVLLLWEII